MCKYPLTAQQAARKIQQYKAQGYRVAIEIDLSKFFDTVNHDVLMSRVSRKVRDKRVLKLIGKYLRAGVVIDGEQYPTWQGVPQGKPAEKLSQENRGVQLPWFSFPGKTHRLDGGCAPGLQTPAQTAYRP